MNCLIGMSRRLNCNTIKNFRLLVNNLDSNLNSIQHKLPLITNQSIVRYSLIHQNPTSNPNRRSRAEVLSSNDLFCQRLEKQLSEERRSGRELNELLRKLLIGYCRRSQLFDSREDTQREEIAIRVKQIWDELKQNEYMMSDSIYSSLLEFYTNSGDVETALQIKNQISKTFPLDSFKVFNLATLLVKKGLTSNAIDLITEQKNRRLNRFKRFEENKDLFQKFGDKSINRLLNALIDKQIETKVIKKVFLMCVEISPDNLNKTIVGPLVKMHVIKGNFQLALEEFIFCADTYRLLPWSLELMRIFIERDDKSSLDTIVHKSIDTYGRINTLIDLSAAYVYNGRLNEAKRIVETIPKIRQQSIEFICDKFVKDNKFEELIQFIQMIQSIPGPDREALYRLVIRGHMRSGKTDDAINVLSLMKEENIEPTEQTLRLLDRN